MPRPSAVNQLFIDGEVSDQEKEQGRRWSEYHRPNFRVLEAAIAEIVQTDRLAWDALLAKLAMVKLPRPARDLSQVAVIVILQLLESGAIRQADDLTFHPA